MASINDEWSAGDLYEPYVGRWSRLVAKQFVSQLSIADQGRWLDVGCGTGALSQTILESANPAIVHGIDRSPDYVSYVRAKLADTRATFVTGDAEVLELTSNFYDAAVSGLLINFLTRPVNAISAMKRAVKPGGTVAAYVWDYADKMDFMRYFWDAAIAANPAAVDLDEARRFPLCQPEPLRNLFADAGLQNVSVVSIDVETHFKNFDDFWKPFLGGQGPAPSYLNSLTIEQRESLREDLEEVLPRSPGQSIKMISRAWMVQGQN